MRHAREKSDTAQIAVLAMGAAILGGALYLLLRNDPGIPPPVGSQVPDKAPPPPPPAPTFTVQATYAVPMSDSPFQLHVGDTVMVVPTVKGGDWGRPTVSPVGGLVHAAGLTDLGVQSDSSYMFRADSPGQVAISYGYSSTTGTQNHSQVVTVVP